MPFSACFNELLYRPSLRLSFTRASIINAILSCEMRGSALTMFEALLFTTIFVPLPPAPFPFKCSHKLRCCAAFTYNSPRRTFATVSSAPIEAPCIPLTKPPCAKCGGRGLFATSVAICTPPAIAVRAAEIAPNAPPCAKERATPSAMLAVACKREACHCHNLILYSSFAASCFIFFLFSSYSSSLSSPLR